MKVKIINKGNQPTPKYATIGSAGVDLRANLEGSLLLRPMQRALIPTGLYIEIPMCYEAQVRPRSGLAIKKGLTVINAPGTIDSDYRGEIGVPIINLSTEEVIIEPGERIAQMVIAPYDRVEFVEVEELSETERGAGGFGSTGTK